MPNKKRIAKISKKAIISFIILSTVFWSAGPAALAAPTVKSITVTTTSAQITFDQQNMITAGFREANYAKSIANLSNYALRWGAGNTIYPLAGMPDLFAGFSNVSGTTDGVAGIFGLNLTGGDAFSLTVSNVANSSLETVTTSTTNGTVAASSDPLINYIENISGTAETNNCFGYPCGKASQQIRIKGARFNLTGVEVSGIGSTQSVTPSDAQTIVMNIPNDVSVGNDTVRVKNLNNNTFSNGKYLAAYSNSCGAVKGALTDSSDAVGTDQNNVPVRLTSWNNTYGETKSHSNGYYAIVAYANSACQTGSYDVFFTTPAGATEAAPTEVGSQTVAANAVKNAGTAKFATIEENLIKYTNVTGSIKGPVATSDENVGMNMITVTVHNDSWSVIQRATTDKNGAFSVYVPTSSSSNYYTIEADPNPFYTASPYLYMKGRANIILSQNGKALNQTVRLTTKNVTGTVMTPVAASSSNPSPNVIVPNARVGIHNQDWSVNEWTNAGLDGTFSFGIAAGSNYILEVEAPWGNATFGTYSRNTYTGLTIESGLTNLDTVISGGPRLGVPNVFGRVYTDKNSSGGYTAGAEEELANAYTHLNKEGYWSGMNTGTDGRFSFTVSQAGVYRIYVDSPSASYSSRDYEITISSSEVINGKNLGDIALSAPNVTGKVYDPTGATPQQNIGIEVCPYNAQGQCYWGNTSSETINLGAFGVGTVPDGRWQFNLKIYGTSIYAAPSAKILVISGGTVTTVDGVANTGNAILNDLRLADPTVNGLLGVVKGPVGSAAENTGQEANLGLRLQGSTTGVSTWANSNSQGLFAFGSVSAGTYELEVMPYSGSSYSRAIYTITVAADGTITSITSGFTALGKRNIQIRLTQPNISGTVKTPVWNSAYSGLGIAEAQFDLPVQYGWVNLHKAGPMTGQGGWYGTNTRSDDISTPQNEAGTFSFGGVEAGDYVIEYQAGWGSAFSTTQENLTISSAVAAGTSLDLNNSSTKASGEGASRAIRLSLPQLRGTVVKPGGTITVQNAWVNVFNPSNWGMQPQGSNTDAEGKFSIGGLIDNTTYTLEVNMPWGQGLVAPSALTVEVANNIGVVKQAGTTLPNNKITLQEPTNTLSGWVKKSGTAAVSSARVEAHKDMGGGFVETRTDTSGNYSMKLADGSWWVGVSPDWGTEIDWSYTDPQTRMTFGSSNPTQQKNFSVSPTNATIYGYVKKADPQTGAITAVNNCWVNICQDKGMCNGRNTDSSGLFSIKVSAGTYRVSAFPPGDLMQTFDSPDEKIVTVSENNTADAGTLTLKAKNSHIKGRVQDQAGNAVQNVVVNVFKFAAPGWGMSYTDTNGAYDITVSAGAWGVMVMPMSNQYVYQGGPLQVTILASETKSDNDFILKLADATIKGKVRLDSVSGDIVTDLWGGVWIKDTSANDMIDFGGPMDDMMEKSGMMAAGGGTGTMGGGMASAGGMGTGIQNGAFQLKVPAGNYEIGIGTPPGSSYTLSGTATKTVLSDSDPSNTLGYTEVNLVVVRNDKTVSGHFYLDNNNNNSYDSGEEVSGLRAMVQASKVGGGWQMTESDSSTGAYSLAVSAGEWYFDAFVDPFMSFGLGQNQYMVVSSDQKITIASATNTLNFEVKSLNATISGTVTDNLNAAIAGVWVFADYGSSEMLTEFKGPGGPGIGDFTDASGNYSIKVTGGTYKIGAGIPPWDTRDLINPDFRTVTVASNATSGNNNLKFLASDATISGTITHDNSSQAGFVRAWSDSGRGTGIVSTDGAYSLKVTQGDTWYVVAVAEVSNVLHESSEAAVVVDSASESQNLALNTLGLTIPDPKTTSFDSSTSKTLTLTDGLTVEMPAGSIDTSGTVTVTVTPTVDVKPDAKEKPIGITYSFNARNADGQEISDLAQNVTITMPYNEDLIESAGYSEDSITPKYYNETTGTWENYDTVIRDTENNNLIIITDHFSDGGPVGEGGVPTAPSGLTATAQSTTSISLSWTDNSTDETGFKVYRAGVLIATTSADATSYTDTGLAASTAYTYYVKATNTSGDSSVSNTATATTTRGGGVIMTGGGGAPAEAEAEVTLAKPIAQMTTAELMAKIAEIQALILQLQAQILQLSGGIDIPADYKFKIKLKYGQKSDDIKYLQIFLKSQGSDIYPEGLVTGYFGPMTQKAVIRFQEKHSQDILAPFELTAGTGLVGEKTLLKISEILGR